MKDLLISVSSGDRLIMYLVPLTVVLGILISIYLVYDGYRVNKRLATARQAAGALGGFGEYPCLFRCHDNDSTVLLIDGEVIDAITDQTLELLTESERWLVLWYRREKAAGPIDYVIPGVASMADWPQDEICKEFRAMQEAPTLEDPDLG